MISSNNNMLIRIPPKWREKCHHEQRIQWKHNGNTADSLSLPLSFSLGLCTFLSLFPFLSIRLCLSLSTHTHTHTHTHKYIYIYIYIYHHHHHVVPQARISLTISRHFSLSFIASGRSSGLHPVSSHSC